MPAHWSTVSQQLQRAGIRMRSSGPRAHRSSTQEILKSEERRVGKECRSLCDWSSDVCSSDLDAGPLEHGEPTAPEGRHQDAFEWSSRSSLFNTRDSEIGRASCRERV